MPGRDVSLNLFMQSVFEKIRTDCTRDWLGMRNPHESPFRPPRLEAEAERTISNYSLAANSIFNFLLYPPQFIPTKHILFLEISFLNSFKPLQKELCNYVQLFLHIKDNKHSEHNIFWLSFLSWLNIHLFVLYILG